MAHCPAISSQEKLAASFEAMDVDEDERGGAGEANLGRKVDRQEDGEFFPPYWMRMTSDTPTVAVILHRESEEYNTVLAFFLSSMRLTDVNVKRIFRIQNVFLWKHYLLKKEEMKHEHGWLEVDERQLFHGTKACHVDGICRKGFDWRLSSRTKFGDGCYFARKSSYSHNYSPPTEAYLDFPATIQSAVSTSSFPAPSHLQHYQHFNSTDPSSTLAHQTRLEGNKLGKVAPQFRLLLGTMDSASLPSLSFRKIATQMCMALEDSLVEKGPGGLRYMFVARVLVGRSVRGNSCYRRPPALHPGIPSSGIFDSCVDSEYEPNIFVIFDSNQAYPEYVLEYSAKD